MTLKTIALVSLSSSDRGQTIHLMDLKNMSVSNNEITFVIFDRLKNSRKMVKPKLIKCPISVQESLNVSLYVSEYIKLTEPYREVNGKFEYSKLFLSWVTKKPVTKQTLARWLKTSLSLAGIDVTQFSAHSYRGAGLSAAKARGASLNSIVAHGCWRNVSTFNTYYSAPEDDSEVGRIIMNQMN